MEANLDRNRVDGTGTKMKGSIKETIGNVTGDTRLQAEGGADRAAGSAQAGFGRFLDAIRRIFTGRPTL